MREGFREKLALGVSVRRLSARDIPRVREILSECVVDRITGSPDLEEAEQYIDYMKKSLSGERGRNYWVADENGIVNGVGGTKLPDKKLSVHLDARRPIELINLFVPPNERGRGMGTSVVSKIEEESRRKNYDQIVLTSGERYKKSGWRFYDNYPGFEMIKVVEDFFGKGFAAQIWIKKLDQVRVEK